MFRKNSPPAVLTLLTGLILLPGSAPGQPVDREMRMYNLWGILPPGEEAEEMEEQGDFSVQPATPLEGIQPLIKKFIDPDSWENRRNQIKRSEGRLIVLQRPEVLDRIGHFLGRLEDHLQRKVLLELALVPPGVLDGLIPGWRNPGGSPWQSGSLLDRAVQAAGESGRYFAARLRDGSRKAISPASISMSLADHEVNQTGVVPVINPVIRGRGQGLQGSARALVDPSGKWIRVDLTLGWAATPEGSIEKRRLPLGDVELLKRLVESIETSVVTPPGKTAILGSCSLQGGEPGTGPFHIAFLLRVRKLFEEERGNETGPQIIRCSFLTRPLPLRGGFTLQRWYGDESWEEEAGEELSIAPEGDKKKERALASPEFLEAALKPILSRDPGSRMHLSPVGLIFFQGRGETLEAIRLQLSALARERARPVAIHLWQGAVPEGDIRAIERSGFILPEKWIEKFQDGGGHRIRLLSLNGVLVGLNSMEGKGYIGDLEKVSGGIDSTILEVADPVVKSAREGIAIKALAELVPGTDWAQLRIQGELFRKPMMGRKTRVRASQRVEVMNREKAEGIQPLGEWVDIDLPVESTERWQHLVTVPLGKPILLNALPDPEEGGKTRILLALVEAPALPPVEEK